jgi:hypothetical protein
MSSAHQVQSTRDQHAVFPAAPGAANVIVVLVLVHVCQHNHCSTDTLPGTRSSSSSSTSVTNTLLVVVLCIGVQGIMVLRNECMLGMVCCVVPHHIVVQGSTLC